MKATKGIDVNKGDGVVLEDESSFEGRISMEDILDPLGDYAKKKLEIRKRKGYHQTWKRPDELEEALQMGYRQVRKLSSDQEKDGKKVTPGEESGEVKKIGKEDNPELIAMEIREEVYQRHLHAVAYKSRGRYKENKESFREFADRQGVGITDDEE